ncbi:putative ABC transport system permease protein [Paenibacillus tianmuensis]|uniref:Putative ABC transport system permease protein n=1 Tax=Paenibacillus tianmuensis TaxID=624147 RepID=A0A1G4SMK1_9BACL|nr:ABC transporter permease [Paenibacillus tianmuensis]SCW70241.1 putative ABC transport system permease protein [Paenibacillus tianmuensis]
MNFRQLALKNIQGNWHRYVAFFLSSTFSVMVFYMFGAFIYHPEVANGQIRAANMVKEVLFACQILIVVFSFFFVLYASFAFLKTRKKEFGLLTLFGMTRSQISRLMFYEQMMIGLLSVGVGIGAGMLFSKLFFLAIARLLQTDSPLSFIVPPQALLQTVVGFLALFLAMTLFAMFSVGRSQIITLLRAAKQPKKPPVASPWLTALAVLCLGSGYYLAFTTSLKLILVLMLPIIFLTVLGTYFLFTQASVAIIHRLQRMTGLYYNRTNLIAISQLAFKMKDNARTLFVVSVLSAVILTASGTIYVFYKNSDKQVMEQFPNTISFTEQGLNAPKGIGPEKIKAVLAAERASLAKELKIVGVQVPLMLDGSRALDTKALLISEFDYNRAAEGIEYTAPLQIAPGHAVFSYPYRNSDVKLMDKGSQRTVQLDGQSWALEMDGQVTGGVINLLGEPLGLLVVNDGEYAQMMGKVPDDRKLVYYGFDLNRWQEHIATVEKVKQSVPEEQRKKLFSPASIYAANKQSSALSLLIGLFVSFLFFVASASMLYFKLFTELQDDDNQYRALMRIGMSVSEVRRIINVQIGLLFLLPVVVGAAHAAFAYKTLANLLSMNIWSYGALVISIFAVLQFGYFLLTRRAYMAQMKSL